MPLGKKPGERIFEGSSDQGDSSTWAKFGKTWDASPDWFKVAFMLMAAFVSGGGAAMGLGAGSGAGAGAGAGAAGAESAGATAAAGGAPAAGAAGAAEGPGGSSVAMKVLGGLMQNSGQQAQIPQVQNAPGAHPWDYLRPGPPAPYPWMDVLRQIQMMTSRGPGRM